MNKVNLAQKFTLFDDYWHPRIVGELNESYVKIARLWGPFVWHQHEQEDELFLVLKGRLLLRFRDSEVWLEHVKPPGSVYCSKNSCIFFAIALSA